MLPVWRCAEGSSKPDLKIVGRFIATGVGELAMKISSIGWGAKYAIEEGPNGPKLRKWKPVLTGVIASHVDLADAAE